MRQYIPVITLAAALALLLGVLLPSDNAVFAADPEFKDSSDPITRSVDENTPEGVNIGAPIFATDADESVIEYRDTLTYSLEGTDAESFDIDPSTGQLITKAELDFENPQGGSGNDSTEYEVTVKVEDSGSPASSATRAVTIEVEDVNEPPAAPAPPAVVSGEGQASTTSLKVVWHAPENTGPTITGYDVQYKKTTALSFTDNGVTESGTSATISPTPSLDSGTSYHVRVQATTDEGTGPWSLVGTGSTNKEGNSPPTFGVNAAITRNVFENTSAGEDIGAPVTANDADATTLTYRLEGPDAALFSFVTSSGQIRTKSPLNHENVECGYDSTAQTPTCTYRVTVTVSDGVGGSDATPVNIMVGDRHEPVLAPARPTVRGAEKSSTSLDVSWRAPANTGPPITGYEVRYREGSSGEFSNDNCGSTGAGNCENITGTKTKIVDLNPGKPHQVQVLTILAGGGKSIWSDIGTGSTNPANKEPRFDDRPSSGDGSARGTEHTTSRSVDENTASGRPVGSEVRAEDGDGHTRTYKLVAADSPNADDVDKFDINKTTGQILTKESLNYEDTDCGYDSNVDNDDDPNTSTTCTYTVKVEVRDGLDTHKVEEEDENPDPDDSITVTINVRDRAEAPAVPEVTVTSPLGNTTLNVVWDTPDNTGPTPITYDVQYRKGSVISNDNCESESEDKCDGLTGTNTTITELEEDTSYPVQVRARNIEGVSAWSRAVKVKTNKGTNTPPNLSGATSTFTVAENGPSRELLGIVTATDGDSDTWTYSLEGGRQGIVQARL